ncbi:hypothetical protein BFJ69_g13607 [Fusarium oxysporum]|uniref:Uncharacterized protein n=1 Tax=Fusarium oxysporum TaxID=5507 RepID=A0A420MKB2_FUSOX|nr:hypothetical protein BFJ69_g13607 [Fusarium oxysporum]
MQHAAISTGVPALASRFTCPSTDSSWCPISVQNCSLPLKRGCSSTNSHSSCSVSMLLSDLSCPLFLLFTNFAGRLSVSGTVGGTARNYPSKPVLTTIFATCTANGKTGMAGLTES